MVINAKKLVTQRNLIVRNQINSDLRNQHVFIGKTLEQWTKAKSISQNRTIYLKKRMRVIIKGLQFYCLLIKTLKKIRNQKEEMDKKNKRKKVSTQSQPDKDQARMFPLAPEGKFSVIWNVVILVLLLIVSIETPYKVCI